MNRLPIEKRVAIVGMLVEGMSLRAITRLADVSINTVTKLLVDIGTACQEYQDKALCNLPCKRLQCDEIWSFCYSKEKNIPAEKQGVFGYGDVWTWVAIDADTKLVPCWHHGRRDAVAAHQFINDLASRLRNRVQVTTDGHRPYLQAIEGAFGCDVDYAMLVKLYGNPPDDRRYSPGDCIGCETHTITGNPDPEHISTSYIERQNLTMRMSMRRFTRLTNGFSKKLENLRHAVSLHYMVYNFARIHKTLRTSPAQAAGITDKLWNIEDIVRLLDETIF
jgi:IS1 family transposase